MLETILAEISVSFLLVIGLISVNIWHEPERKLYVALGPVAFFSWATTELINHIKLDLDDE